jgi:flavorubredoxin
LVDDRRALLLDTGLTIHADDILAQLREVMVDVDDLDVVTLRTGEFDSICNLVDILDAFPVRTLYGHYDDVARWADVHPGRRLADVPSIAEIEERVVHSSAEIELGPSRRVQLMRPSLRLLGTHWVYDEATRTLFTSDAFSYAIAPVSSGPWVIDDDLVADDTELEDVRRHLLTTRFWWLANSHCEQLRRDLADVFERFDVETVAPAFGRILQGREVVQRHVHLIDSVMAEIDQQRKAAA